MCIFAKSIVGSCAIDRSLRERWIHPTFPPPKDHLNFNVLDVRIWGRGEGVRVNPNIVRIVMHIGIYGRSLNKNKNNVKSKIGPMRHWCVGILLAGTRKVDRPCTEVRSHAVLDMSVLAH